MKLGQKKNVKEFLHVNKKTLTFVKVFLFAKLYRLDEEKGINYV